MNGEEKKQLMILTNIKRAKKSTYTQRGGMSIKRDKTKYVGTYRFLLSN